MRPERRIQGSTLMRTRIVVVPTIKLSPPERDGRGDRQCKLTAGSSACVPESSMGMDFPCAAPVQNMVSAAAKKKAAAGRAVRLAIVTADSFGRGGRRVHV